MTDIICFRMIYEIADYCVQNEVAHNFYMTKGPVFGEERNSLKRTIRVYFWARRKVVGMYFIKIAWQCVVLRLCKIVSAKGYSSYPVAIRRKRMKKACKFFNPSINEPRHEISINVAF